jgi:outer membrane biosynthesis protein TonB
MVVDHGKFAKLEASESSGDIVLDQAAVSWLRKNWKFAPTQSGSFNLPVSVAIAKE